MPKLSDSLAIVNRSETSKVARRPEKLERVTGSKAKTLEGRMVEKPEHVQGLGKKQVGRLENNTKKLRAAFVSVSRPGSMERSERSMSKVDRGKTSRPVVEVQREQLAEGNSSSRAALVQLNSSGRSKTPGPRSEDVVLLVGTGVLLLLVVLVLAAGHPLPHLPFPMDMEHLRLSVLYAVQFTLRFMLCDPHREGESEERPRYADAPVADMKAPAVDLKAPADDLKAPAPDLKAPAADLKAPAATLQAPKSKPMKSVVL